MMTNIHSTSSVLYTAVSTFSSRFFKIFSIRLLALVILSLAVGNIYGQVANVVSGSPTSGHIHLPNINHTWNVPLNSNASSYYSPSGSQGAIISFNYGMQNLNNQMNPGCCGGNSSPSMTVRLYVNNQLIWSAKSPNDDNVHSGDFNVHSGTLLNGPSMPWSMSTFSSGMPHNVRIRLPYFSSINTVKFTFNAGQDDADVRVNYLNATLSCTAGSNAPSLSTYSLNNVCPATTANLTSISAFNTPSGATLSWHTGSPATNSNLVSNPSAVGPGTYYAAFKDAANNCYSGTNGNATSAVTVGNIICPCTDPLKYADNCDFDGDGVLNMNDLDDDNDGIPDSDEESGCGVAPIVKSSVTVSSSLNWSGSFANVVNNSNSNAVYAYPNGTSIANQTYLKFQFPTAVILDIIELKCHGNGILSSGSQIIVQGSNDNSNWTNLSGAISTGMSTGLVSGGNNCENFSFTNTNSYTYYRLWGVSGSVIWWYLQEANFNQVMVACDEDNDGILNRFDLDSDNDGCSDAAEAGHNQTINGNDMINGPFGTNGLANSVETPNGSGILNYTIVSNAGTYNFIDASIAACCHLDAATTTTTVNAATNCVPGNNGKIKISNGGIAPNETYSVSYQFNGNTVNVSPNPTSNSNGKIVLNGLQPGTYSNIMVSLPSVSSCSMILPNSVTVQPFTSNLQANESHTNVSCNGLNDGSASVTVTGGQSPFSYSWSNGQTTSAINNLAPGTYTVTVTDNKGCEATDNVTITEPIVLNAGTISVSTTNVSCNGGNDGSATVTVTGGTAPYTYLWSDGQTTATASNLAAGTYTVLVTDANNCSFDMNASNSIVITEPVILDASTISISLTNVSCNGGNDGSATVNVTGGTAPYTYLWSDGQITAAASNLLAGTYTVLVTDANNCSFNMSTSNGVTITEPTVLNPSTISVSTTNVSCNGLSDGSATVTVTGGTAPYTYLWSDGQTTATASNLVAGTYTVLVTDANNCSFDMNASNSIVITEPIVLNAGTISVSTTNVSCNGLSDGSATVTVTGGTAPYTYLWNDGQTTATASNLTAGTYTVLVTDANNCSFDMNASNSIVITEPIVLNAGTISLSTTNVSCNGGNDGSATVNVTGGTAPYTYLWSDGQTTATASNLVAGTYTVLVTDNNNCSFDMNASNSIAITEPVILDASTISISSTNVSCNGGNDGLATVNVSGGTAPYTYLWSDGQTTATASNLAAGTYTVLVTDANNCSFNMSASNGVTITEPTVLNPSTISVSTVNVSCNGLSDGSATVNVIGGTAPYTYLWSDGQTTATASNLVAGTYTVLVTDNNNCSFDMNASNSIVITEPVVLDASTISVSTTNVSCNGLSDGSATVTVTGGTASYTYLWSDGQTTATASNLVAGTYTVLVTDANNCSFDMNASNSIVITEPIVLNAGTISVSTTNVSCNGGNDGSATVNVSGGTAPYTYLWSDGQTTATASNLVAGTYTVLVTDANNCSFNMSASNSIVITEPVILDASTISISSTNVSCNGGNDGSATVTVTGGTAPYTYLWSDGQTTATASNLAAGTYTVLVTDANNCSFNMSASNGVTITEPTVLNPSTISVSTVNVSCNGLSDGSATVTVTGGTAPYTYLWSDGQTTATASNLVAGTYTVLVTDANNCSFNMNASNSIVITEPVILDASTISVSTTNVSCNGLSDGSATVTVTGGTAPYTYLWSDGQTTATASNLTAGTYTVLVTDANNCSFDMNASNSIVITEPVILDASTISVSVNNASCNGNNNGSATVTLTGGTAPYTYLWSDGQTTAAATNLSAGTYTVLVTDANNCSFDMTGGNSILVTEPAVVSSESFATVDVTCFGACDGTAAISADGGTAPYTYLWSDGQTTQIATGLCAGTYSVTITDNNNCSYVENNIVINEPPALSNSMSVTNLLCSGDSNGTATATVSGGTPPYTYLWSDGQTTATATNLVAGNYTVTVTDSNNCQIVDNATITEPAPLVNNSVVITNPLCFGDCTGSISVNISGGVAPYTYSWSIQVVNQIIDGDGSPTIFNLCKGVYSVLVTDANGCTLLIENLEIAEPGPIFNNNVIFTDVTCNGGTDGSIALSALGGTMPYTYAWNNGQTTSTAVNLSAGVYSVTISDANQCTLDLTALAIDEPELLTNQGNLIDNITCNGLSNGSITTHMTGGVTPYTYQWSNGENTSIVTGLTAGTYDLTVTDANNCTYTENNIVVSEPTALVKNSVTVVNASCFGECDGSISIDVSGGTGLYTYAWSQIYIQQITGNGTPNVTGLCKGLYKVVVTDANGCSITIDSIEVTEPTPIFTNGIALSNVSCNGGNNGSIALDILGGQGPYTYSWNTGEDTSAISNLTAGIYSAIIEDNNGCIYEESNIVISEPMVLENTDTIITNVSCNGNCDGEIQLNVTGGVQPYTYNWSNTQNTAIASGLCPGTYDVTVTDSNGCTFTETGHEIIQPNELSLQLNATDVNCYTACDGTIDAIVGGGTLPYTYSWNNGQSGANLTNLCPDNYVVSVSDDNGCSATDSVIITQPEKLNLTVLATDASCFGICDGELNSVVTGGVMPYTYSWSNGDSLVSLTNVCADDYTLEIHDANNCIVSSTNTVNEPNEIQAQFNVDYNAGSIAVTPTNGGVAPFTYNWNTGSTGNTISNLTDGTTYVVTIMDDNGCSTVDSVNYVAGGGAVSQMSLSVAPNPFTIQSKISVYSLVEEDILIDVYDLQGNLTKVVYDGHIGAQQTLELPIDGGNLQSGVYMVRILAADNSAKMNKVVVVK